MPAAEHKQSDLSGSRSPYIRHSLQHLVYTNQASAATYSPTNSNSQGQLQGSTADVYSVSTDMSSINNSSHPNATAVMPSAAAGQSCGTAEQQSPAVVGLSPSAALCGQFAVGRLRVQLQQVMSPEDDASKKQNFIDVLLAKAQPYGLGLLGQDEKVACLARLSTADLNSILADPSPEKLLDDLWSMYQQVQQQLAAHSYHLQQQGQQQGQGQLQHQYQHQDDDVYYPPPPTMHQQQGSYWQVQQQQQSHVHYQQQGQQDQQPYDQQQHGYPDSQHQQPQPQQPRQQPQQQQQAAAQAPAKILGPRDLDPAAADVFEASVPAGLLPSNWRDLPRWGAFEMHCKFTVSGSDADSVQQVRNQFKQAKDQAVAATQAACQQAASTDSASEQQQWPASSTGSSGHDRPSCRQLGASISALAAAASPAVDGSLDAAVMTAEHGPVAVDRHGSNGGSSSGSSGGRRRSSRRPPRFVATEVKLEESNGKPDLTVLRQQRLLAALGPKVPEYAQRLAQDDYKFTQLSRITVPDLNNIMEQPRPDQVLEDVYTHICKTRGNKVAQRSGQLQQEEQQHGPTAALRPCDVPRELRPQLVAALPAGVLPETWWTFQTWEGLEARLNLSAVGRPFLHNPWQVLQALHEAVASIFDQCGIVDLPQWQQQERPAPCDLPDDLADYFAAALPARALPADWRSYISWKTLMGDVKHRAFCKETGTSRPSQVKRVFRDAQAATLERLEKQQQYMDPARHVRQQSDSVGVLQQQHVEMPIAVSSSNGGSSSTMQQQQAAKRPVAPCELPPPAAAVLESLVPDGLLPQQWQKYSTWADLDVAVSFTAGGGDATTAVIENTKRYKEAKQAAQAAAAADTEQKGAADAVSLRSTGSLPPKPPAAAAAAAVNHSMSSAQQQDKQRTGSRPGSSSSSSSRAVPEAVSAALAAAPPPSVSWAQATGGTNAAAATAADTGAISASSRAADTERSNRPAAAADHHTSSRSRSVDGNTPRHSASSTSSGVSNSRLGSSNSSAATAAAPHRDQTNTPQADKVPRNGKYVPAGDSFCFRCGGRGHVGEHCSTPYCPSCTQWGHADGIDCLSACYWCGRVHLGANHRCPEAKCRACGLMGHKYYECPLSVCSFCKCTGHAQADCRACGECRLWGHDADHCPGFCNKCNAPGHKTADCSVKRCSQCGKVGCVVGMCRGSSSHSSRSKSKSKGTAGSTATAAAAAKVFDVSSITFEVAEDPQQEEEHKQRLMDRLMSNTALDEYACTLLTDPEKLAVLATISAADLSLILQQQHPSQFLDQIHSMQAIGASKATAAPSSSTAGTSQLDGAPQQQDQGPQQQQQQQQVVIMPCDLWPQHQHMFEGRLPSGSLPEGWHAVATWRELEQDFINRIKWTSARLSDQRVMFRKERQRVQAAAVADMAAGHKPEQAVEQQQEQQQKSQMSPQRVQDNGQQQDQGWQQHSNTSWGGPQSGQQQQQQHSNTGWGGPSSGHQRQQQPATRDGWPVIDEEQQQLQQPAHCSIPIEDTWAAAAPPEHQQQQQPVVKENAWSRKLPFVQQEAQQHEQRGAEQGRAGQEPVTAPHDGHLQQQGGQQEEVTAANSQETACGIPYQHQQEAPQPHEVAAVAAAPMEAVQPFIHPQLLPQQQHHLQQPHVGHPHPVAQLSAYMQDPATAAAAPTMAEVLPYPASAPATAAGAAGVSVQQAADMHPGPYYQQPLLVQQYQAAPIQQQQAAAQPPAKVLGPRDLDPAAADVFEASVPAGLLPSNWRDLPRWGAFEMHCKFTVSGSDADSVQQVRNQFKQAKDQAVAATQAVRAQDQQQHNHHHHHLLMSMPQQQVAGQMPAHPSAVMAAGMHPAAPATAGTVPPSRIYVVGPERMPQQQQQQHTGPVPAMQMAGAYPQVAPGAIPAAATMMHQPAVMLPQQAMQQPSAQQHMAAASQYVPPPAAAGVTALSAVVSSQAPHPAAAGQHVQQMVPGDDADEDLNDMFGLCGVQAA